MRRGAVWVGWERSREKGPRALSWHSFPRHIMPGPSSRKRKAPGASSGGNDGSSSELVTIEAAETYDLLKVVGEGTFSVVHKARRRGDSALVAVKRLKKLEQAATRIRDEVACLRALAGCVHVVCLLDCRKQGGQIDIVMPYFEHDDFASALFAHRFDAAHTQCYMRGLFVALAHIHDRGFIHRDIKPTNVLYSFKHRHTLVVDFGLVQLRAARHGRCSGCSSNQGGGEPSS